MSKEFWEAHIINLPGELEPQLSALLFEYGASGITQNLEFIQPSLIYDAQEIESDFVNLVAYFNVSGKEMAAPWLQSWIWQNAPDSAVHWILQKEQDWLAVWKKHFKPFKLASWNIVPSWHFNANKFPRAKSIILEPGMAFGTGHHATTKSAIRLLAELKKNKKVQRKDILDVGAGSGILSVVSEKCGARKILAVDNDPHCWREAKKTFRLNKTKKCKTTEKQIGQIKSKYDVVVANIIDGVLLQIKSELWRVTKPGGWLVLSGILESHHKDFEEDFFRGQEARVVKRVHDDEWVSLLVQKK